MKQLDLLEVHGRQVRIVTERASRRYRARVEDVATGALLAQSTWFKKAAEAVADARLMVCENESVLKPPA